ncbi:hypothetical protein CFIMG_005871RAa [Ceratocystis fimbriata CBS 114723]|uniref:CCHC-type domain-containing protein n=1 Tax=Ceratocystis fimbriata CBS 114723 TaxID=1035309 RepID=A0A2C5WV14_9PEZI|nr:hypothetical protein CFIMG_005871RAa [Ceratocystis fimbriata CBS 114723]
MANHQLDNTETLQPASRKPLPPTYIYDHSKPSMYAPFQTLLEAQWVLIGKGFYSDAEFIFHCFAHLDGEAAMYVTKYVKTMLVEPDKANVDDFFEHLDSLFAGPAAAAHALEKSISPRGLPKQPRAKWVPPAELQRRRRNWLCFRCGAGGHKIQTCVFRVNNVMAIGNPILEMDETDEPAYGAEIPEY